MPTRQIIQYIKQKSSHRLFPILSFAFTGVVGMFFTPIIGAICVLTVAYLALVFYVPWETFAHKKILLNISKYVTPAIVVYILVTCFGWDRLIALMPSNPTENVFAKQTPRKNAVPTDPNKYELLIEFGARYHESNVDLEINVENLWIGNIDGWWG